MFSNYIVSTGNGLFYLKRQMLFSSIESLLPCVSISTKPCVESLWGSGVDTRGIALQPSRRIQSLFESAT